VIGSRLASRKSRLSISVSLQQPPTSRFLKHQHPFDGCWNCPMDLSLQPPSPGNSSKHGPRSASRGFRVVAALLRPCKWTTPARRFQQIPKIPDSQVDKPDSGCVTVCNFAGECKPPVTPAVGELRELQICGPVLLSTPFWWCQAYLDACPAIVGDSHSS
jgi:hypothetical protein